jgi:hypothetical protein
MAHRSGRGLRILFLLRATNQDRIFENFMDALLARGHTLDLLVDLDKRHEVMGAGIAMDRMAERYPGFHFGVTEPRTDAWLPVATRWRLGLDYLRYREPAFEHAVALRERARSRAPRLLRLAAERTPLGGLAGRALHALEAAVPIPEQVYDLIRAHSPDVVIVAPLIGLGSSQGDYVRAAQSMGIPVVLAVASWDNLTNKGRLRDLPDLTVVWNHAQVEEAVTLHDLPRERVEAVGAHAFDHWFTWQPSTTADEFARKVGLPVGRRILFYVCSSRFIAPREVEFVAEWLQHLRACPDPELAGAGVIVRPHPQHFPQWEGADLGDPAAVVWPQGGVSPISDQAKADYFDSLYHCSAVIGINTSAQVEAAILKRPVYTLLHERFQHTQDGTLHFSHLTGTAEAGVVTTARSWDEHFAQLSAGVHDRASTEARLEGFVRTFIRPYGIDEVTAPSAAAAIERAAAAGHPAKERGGVLARVLEAATPLLAVGKRAHELSRELVLLRHRARVGNRRARRRVNRVYRRTRFRAGALLGRGPAEQDVTPSRNGDGTRERERERV